MADEQAQAKGPAKGIRVSTATHARIRQYMHKIHADSMEEALANLLGANVIHIPMPAEVMERWEAEADASGFTLPHWVAQRVEAYLANRAYAGEVRAALNELLGYRRSMQTAAMSYGITTPPQVPKKPAGPADAESLRPAQDRP